MTRPAKRPARRRDGTLKPGLLSPIKHGDDCMYIGQNRSYDLAVIVGR